MNKPAFFLAAFLPVFTAACLLCGLWARSAQAQLAADAYNASLPAPPVSASVAELRLQGIVKTLQQYPGQSDSILRNYVGIDTSRIDPDKFDALIARGDTQEIYREVAALSANRDAFNAGAFTGVSTYRDPTLAPAAVENAPMEAAQTETAQTEAARTTGTQTIGKETGTTETAGTDVVGKANANRSWAEQPYSGTVAGVAVAAAIGVAVASGGGGGGGDDDTTSPDNGADRDITFGRTPLPDLFTPGSFVDAEFNAYPLGALAAANAQHAYAKGLTGSGVKIGVYDFFSTDATADAELSPRIVYRNLNLAADNTVMADDCAASGGNDPAACDHGRIVMQYAAAGRNGANAQGFAPGASLMMESAGPLFSTPTTLADNGAEIVNFSCTGCLIAPLSELQYLADQDVFMAAATGNDDNGVNPRADSPAAYASQLDYSMIAVTGVYEIGGVLTNASYNACGSQSEYCMAAYSDIGTSFASPQVSGAAALLKQGWNFLTASQIGQILLYSAQDIGAAGVDPVYGHGLLDLQAATNPVGTLSVLNGAGQRIAYAPSRIAQNRNTAFGDAFAAPRGTGQVIGIDRFGRNFAIAPQDHLSVAATDRFSPRRIAAFGRAAAPRTVALSDRLNLSFNRAPGNDAASQNANGGMMAFADYGVTPATRVQMGFASDINALPAGHASTVNGNDFIAPETLRNGYLNLSDNDRVLHQAVSFAPSQAVEMKLRNYDSRNGRTNDATDFFGQNPDDGTLKNDFTASVLDLRVTPSDALAVTFSNGVTHEYDSVLGTRTTGSFAMRGGADTYFTGIDTSYDVGENWTLGAAYTVGSTQAKAGRNAAFSQVSDILSDSFAVTATRGELLGRDALSLSVGQPTRVRAGTLNGLTQQVDPGTGTVQTVGFQQGLVPTGRTLQFQLAYQRELSDDIGLNLALAHESQPYQRRDASAETSGLAKLVYRFR